MAIGLDGHSKVTGSGSGPLTLNHACGGVQRLLVVVFSGVRGSLTSWSSSVTFNGAAMTLGAANESAGNSRNVRTEVWYLVNPPGGRLMRCRCRPARRCRGFRWRRFR